MGKAVETGGEKPQLAPAIVQARKSKALTSCVVVSLKEALNKRKLRPGRTQCLVMDGGR